MKVVIVFTTDNDYCVLTAVAITSLILARKISTFYKIYIMYFNLTKEEQKLLKSFEKNYENVKISLINFYEKISIIKMRKDESYSPAIFFRILIPEILTKYRRVIYSDSDVIFKGDLSEIFQIDLNNKYLAVCCDLCEKREIIPGKIISNYKYFGSGFLVMNLDLMRQKHVSKKCWEIMETHWKFLKLYDQDLLNLVCLGKVRYISHQYATPREHKFVKRFKKIIDRDEFQAMTTKTIVLHYVNIKHKPWRKPEKYPEWLDMAKKSPYKIKSPTKLAIIKRELIIFLVSSIALFIPRAKQRKFKFYFYRKIWSAHLVNLCTKK